MEKSSPSIYRDVHELECSLKIITSAVEKQTHTKNRKTRQKKLRQKSEGKKRSGACRVKR